MFEFTCPYCSHRSNVSESLLGKSGPCAQCDAVVVMPSRSASGRLIPALQSQNSQDRASQDALSNHAPGSRSTPTTRPASPLSTWILTASIATLALLALLTVSIGITELRRWGDLQAIRADYMRMKSVVEAINNYYERYDTYPPPVVHDATGKPLYSWRVLILPFLGYQDLYDSYQLDQPWDSPANTYLLSKMPREYCSSRSPDAWEKHEPNVFLLTGNGTIFPPSGPITRDEILDSPTLLLIQSNNGSIAWSEPGDVDTQKGNLKVGNTPQLQIGGLHSLPGSFLSTSSLQSRPSVALGVGAKAEPVLLTDRTSRRMIDALISPNGAEKISPEESLPPAGIVADSP